MGTPIRPGQPGAIARKWGNIAVCLDDLKTVRLAPDGKSVTITLCQECVPLTPVEAALRPNTITLFEIPTQ